jgi:hypothetical protein
MSQKISWPEGKDFAFTVFDDTDRATVKNVGEVYALLDELGFRTTKSVWPLATKDTTDGAGSSCEEQPYLEWVKKLQEAGFEIGYHMAASRSSPREETIRGLRRFAELFGHYPKTMANHVGCRENLYWGSDRISGLNRFVYNVLTLNRRNGKYQGHIRNSPYFWGDICKEEIRFVRNFVFPEINTLRMCPMMPYHDTSKPYVNYWFASSGGSTVSEFNQCISEENQDRLDEQGGACIMYAHFAFGFYDEGRINPGFKHLMERLARKNGWFVPVATLLDYLLELNGGHIISEAERARLERAWLSRKILRGTA